MYKKKIVFISIISLILILIICILCVVLPALNDSGTEKPLFYELEKNITGYKTELFSDYSKYNTFMSQQKLKTELTEKDFKKKNYLALTFAYNECREEVVGVKVKSNTQNNVKIEVKVNTKCGYCINTAKLFLIPVSKNTKDNAKIEVKVKKHQTEKCSTNMAYKPIIYLYPTSPMNVTVKLGYPDAITTSYPKYESSWEVNASPNGELTELKSNKKLYALYWEGKINHTGNSNEGFVVGKEKIATFLEEKLSFLGLNTKEQEEFIIYWLPELEKNPYNFIRFMTEEEIEAEMPLEINPKPDNIIRIWMQYKGVSKNHQVKEQKLLPKERTGFTVVEWGGTKLY